MKSLNEIVRGRILAEAAQMEDPLARDVYVDTVLNRMPQTELLERISDALASAPVKAAGSTNDGGVKHGS